MLAKSVKIGLRGAAGIWAVICDEACDWPCDGACDIWPICAGCCVWAGWELAIFMVLNCCRYLLLQADRYVAPARLIRRRADVTIL